MADITESRREGILGYRKGETTVSSFFVASEATKISPVSSNIHDAKALKPFCGLCMMAMVVLSKKMQTHRDTKA